MNLSAKLRQHRSQQVCFSQSSKRIIYFMVMKDVGVGKQVACEHALSSRQSSFSFIFNFSYIHNR